MNPPSQSIRRRPHSHRRRLSTPVHPRRRPPTLSLCRPLPPSLDALDLSSASPTQTLASLRFLVLSYLAEVELRLSVIKRKLDVEPEHSETTTIEEVQAWARTTLEILDSIRTDVCSHLPDFALPDITVDNLRAHLPDLPSVTSRFPDFDFAKFDLDFNDFDIRNKLDDVRTRFHEFDFNKSFECDFRNKLDDVRSCLHEFDFNKPFEYIPTLSAHLQTLQSHLSSFELPQFELASSATLHSLHVMLSDMVDSLVSSEFVNDILGSAPEKGLKLKDGLKESFREGEEMVEQLATEVAHAVKRSLAGMRLITYSDLPTEWKNNPFVTQGYRFIPIERWPLIIMSLFALHNETLNIHTHLVPFFLWFFNSIPLPNPFNIPAIPFVFNPASLSETDVPEMLFMSFALLCLFSSALWHTMSGCAHLVSMEFCARVDYVGIGWLISASVGTIVHYGFRGCHPILHQGFLALCFATGLAGNIFPFMKWFNEYDFRIYRVLFFLSLAFSALAPLGALAMTHSFREMITFIGPVVPSLLSYIVGLVFYVSHAPERWMSEKWRRRMDMIGGGSHCIWHCFIVLAVSQHKAAIKSLREGIPCYA